ncbi:hypothetical protein HKX48_007973 [Thoreauomyces humboldtii]|nr:hypothetical protein HKX48_007973 [Thoreauomyces humboldtii]
MSFARNLFSQIAGKGADNVDATRPPVGPSSPSSAGGQTPVPRGSATERRMPRKSLGRRVSFAPQAHVRPVTPNKTVQPETPKFKVPDLHSVRRESGYYDLRLSPGAAIRSEHSDTSYEIDLAPEHHISDASDHDDSTETLRVQAVPPPPPSPPKATAAGGKMTRKRKATRDSIAVFFDSPQRRAQDEEVLPRGSEDCPDDSNYDVEMTDPTRTESFHRPESEDWPGYPEADSSIDDMDVDDMQAQSVEMSMVTDDVTTDDVDDILQHVSPVLDAHMRQQSEIPRRSRLRNLDDTIAGFMKSPAKDAQAGSTSVSNPGMETSSSEDEESAVLHQVRRARTECDDTIAGFFSEKDGDKKRKARLIAADDNDDTIGNFFGGPSVPRQHDSSDDDMEVTSMEITKTAKIMFHRQKIEEDDTTNSAESIQFSATPTQNPAERRRSSLRSATRRASNRSQADPGTPLYRPSPLRKSTPAPTPRATPAKSCLRKVQVQEIESPAPAPRQEGSEEHLLEKVLSPTFAHMHLDDDLMDEPLPMLDESFMTESNTITTVSEFLEAIDIHFEDDLDANPQRDASSYLQTDPDEVDFYLAALLWSSELDTYEFGCKDLQQAVTDVRQDLKLIEAEAAANPPPIFFEAAESDADDLAELQRRMKAINLFARKEAKHEWHTWRNNLVNNLCDYFTFNLEQLRKDERKIQRFGNRYADIQNQIDQALAAKKQELADKRKRYQAEQKAADDHYAALAAKAEEQRIQIAFFKNQIATMKLECEAEQAKQEKLLAEKIELTAAIAQSEHICQDLMVFDPEELASLRDEYKLLTSMFPWRSLHVDAGRHVLVYDDSAQVSLTKAEAGTLIVDLSLMDVKKPLLPLMSQPFQETNPVIVTLGRSKLYQVLKNELPRLGVCQGPRDVSRITTHVAYVWNALQSFAYEVETARRSGYALESLDTISDQQAEKGMSTLAVRTSFVSRKTRTRFFFTVGVSCDPEHRWLRPTVKWTWDAEIVYGSVRQEQIRDVIASAGDATGKLCKILRGLSELARSPPA